MKYILIIFLVLPNVFCFIINSHKRFRHQRPSQDGSYGKISGNHVYTDDTVILGDRGKCSDMFGIITSPKSFEITDVLTGRTKTIQEVECISKKGKKFCRDYQSPLDHLYFCKEETDYICLDETCKIRRQIIIGCDCNYH